MSIPSLRTLTSLTWKQVAWGSAKLTLGSLLAGWVLKPHSKIEKKQKTYLYYVGERLYKTASIVAYISLATLALAPTYGAGKWAWHKMRG